MKGPVTESVTRPLPLGRLRELARAATGSAEERHRCELCGEIVPDEHRHLLRLPSRELSCACRACAVLFDRANSRAGRYRAVPESRERLSGTPVDDVGWAALGVPVGLAFFVRHDDVTREQPDTGDDCDDGDDGHDADASGAGEGTTVTAYYPSPLGVVGTDVDPQAWERLVRKQPSLARLEPEVRALLVHRDIGEQWLVGIDECYRLVARVRGTWSGMTGGDEVWHEIGRFFAELRGDGVPA
ncbi:DUF5947 family protein [Saccharomonospora xinjiangensis]|uniref:DUF5947 family protein n=1 Tax=Saccharomonospora xinjiangensis TaxID=75294 RepID=UPI00350F27E1